MNIWKIKKKKKRETRKLIETTGVLVYGDTHIVVMTIDNLSREK